MDAYEFEKLKTDTRELLNVMRKCSDVMRAYFPKWEKHLATDQFRDLTAEQERALEPMMKELVEIQESLP